MSEHKEMHESVKGTAPEKRARTIVNCNFRAAGRLSNEVVRSLTGIHETFARHMASVLDVLLGTGVEVKLKGLDQFPVREHIAAIAPLSYLVPLSLSSGRSTMIVECDIGLVFPMIELLLGGAGTPEGGARELSEIEEEIMHEVVELIARQAETAWHMPSQSLAAGRRTKSSQLHQYCSPNEKMTLVKFEVELAGTMGRLDLVFPTAFLNVLIQQIKMEAPQKRGSLRQFPRPSIRERILDCDFEVAAELPMLKVAVRDLINLQPGSVLKLRAPVQTPGMLTVGGRGIFEATPVRNGSQKAAQLGRRTLPGNWERR
ncbi:MAG TPA: FliM/FliN family flagellar motor switch protein [Acidobacteriaceae bacterium]|nr:FliM/FliN family flagellar motor switch protein [Acidobacteriaceae bacterium]